MPRWGGDLSNIDFDSIVYYKKPTEKQANDWDDVPKEIKDTFDRLGIPEAERKFLAGVGAQFESENVYHKLREDLEKLGVIFIDPNTGLQKYPHIFKKWFGKVIPIEDNKFSALNSAFISGGSFIYIPENVHVPLPLQAYFRINSESLGQFERTLIIADKGSKVHYIEGCFPKDEEILTGQELVPIQNIKEGDIVLNSDGKETEVVKTSVRPFSGDLIEIIPISPGNKFKLTPEHPVLAIKRNRVILYKRNNRRLSDVDSEKLLNVKPEFVEAGILEEGDFLIFPINKIERENEKITEDHMHVLGYYLAEGNTSIINGCDAVVFNLNMNERNLIEHIKELVKKIIGKEPSEYTEREKNCTTLTVYSTELKEFCEKHCGKYADKKKLSKEILELPSTKQRLLLKTYYAGDGSEYLRKSIMVRALTVSRQLAFQIQELLSRQGTYASIQETEAFEEEYKGRKLRHKKKYTIY
ncbi:MAG: LAGLIDADG family homing endonuclease, partial [Nanoarchaeota archaeon]